MSAPRLASAACPARQVLDRVADKWTVLIVSALDRGTLRFSQLHAAIGGISHKMLAQTLRALARDGILTRTVYPTVPPKVEYALTDLGRSLLAAVAGLQRWSAEHFDEVIAARLVYDGSADAAQPLPPGSIKG